MITVSFKARSQFGAGKTNLYRSRFAHAGSASHDPPDEYAEFYCKDWAGFVCRRAGFSRIWDTESISDSVSRGSRVLGIRVVPGQSNVPPTGSSGILQPPRLLNNSPTRHGHRCRMR